MAKGHTMSPLPDIVQEEENGAEHDLGDDDDDDVHTEEGTLTEEASLQHEMDHSVRARPPSFQLLQWQRQRKEQVIRSEQFKHMKSYETQRRITFSKKLEATQLYFKSLMDLLEHSVVETATVHRLVKGTSMAHSQYARALMVQSPHQVPQDASPSAALLHSWQCSNTLLAATLEENATDIERNVVTVLSAFEDAQLDQKTQYESIGKPILEELQYMEKQVQQAWDAFWKTASNILEDGTFGVDYHPSTTAQEAVVEEETEKLIPNEDIWIVEMQYQMWVTLQRSTWEKRGPEIARFAASCKEMEVARRIKLNECMVKYLHRVQKMFQGISNEELTLPTPSPTSTPSTAMTADTEPLSESMSEIMLDDSARLPERVKLTIDNSLQCGLELKPPPTISEDETFTLMGLGNNGLVQLAKVLEWKNSAAISGNADRWRTALAVVTVDSFLHVFDLAPFCNQSLDEDDDDITIQPGCDPNVAVQCIFPHILEELNGAMAGNEKAAAIREKMIPETTFELKQCTYLRLSDECCEINQNSQSGAAGTMLFGSKRKSTLSTVQFRILSTTPNSKNDKNTFFFTLWKYIEC